MGTFKVIYLLFSIYGTFGQLHLQESKALEANNVLSTTSDKVSNVLRDILKQESLVRFSVTQKIQGLMLDVADSKNDIEFLKKKLSEVTKELKTLELKNRQMEDENTQMHQELQTLYTLSDHSNETMDNLRKFEELSSTRLQIVEYSLRNFSLLLDDIRVAQNVSAQLLSTLPKDCKALHDMGIRTSRVYSIYPWDDLPKKSVQVYCDMVTDGGGWTVIQDRIDGTVNFSRNWQEYKAGFGDVSTSYWIGNDVIHQLTKNSSSLYVTITDKNGTILFIQYDRFSISGEDDHYRLYVAGKATGTLDDRIRYGTGGDNINGMKFSTYDKDNDLSTSRCTVHHGNGGWWFNNCNDAYLNGQYPPGIWEQPWNPRLNKGSQISSTRMMIRRQ